MEKQLIDTWQIHSRINYYLLDNIEPDWLADQAATKGRTVGEQLAHIHNVRLMWLKEAGPELLTGLAKIEKEAASDRALLFKSLQDSSTAIEKLLEKGFSENRIKGFKPHPAAFLGYLISHESHHRGQVMLSLKQSGHLTSKKLGFGLWEWGVR